MHMNNLFWPFFSEHAPDQKPLRKLLQRRTIHTRPGAQATRQPVPVPVPVVSRGKACM